MSVRLRVCWRGARAAAPLQVPGDASLLPCLYPERVVLPAAPSRLPTERSVNARVPAGGVQKGGVGGEKRQRAQQFERSARPTRRAGRDTQEWWRLGILLYSGSVTNAGRNRDRWKRRKRLARPTGTVKGASTPSCPECARVWRVHASNVQRSFRWYKHGMVSSAFTR